MPTNPQLVLPPINDPSVHAQIDRLARRYLDAGGLGMDLMSVVGNSAAPGGRSGRGRRGH